MTKMIKIETLKEALNIYDYEADKGLWNYISGIISQAESEGCTTVQLENIGTINSAYLFSCGDAVAETYCTHNDNFLIARVGKGGLEYKLVNSDKMTDDDRRALPKDVWIKHDGKSVPVVDGVNFQMAFTNGDKHISNYSLYWKREFEHEIGDDGSNIEKFKILSE